MPRPNHSINEKELTALIDTHTPAQIAELLGFKVGTVTYRCTQLGLDYLRNCPGCGMRRQSDFDWPCSRCRECCEGKPKPKPRKIIKPPPPLPAFTATPGRLEYAWVQGLCAQDWLEREEFWPNMGRWMLGE